MQLKQIGRDALLKPLQAVAGIVERRQTMPILANVLIEHRGDRLYVTATDLEMQITAHSEFASSETRAVTVSARKLQDLLRALPEGALLNVDASGNRMTVRAGRSRFNLQSLPAGDYPRIGFVLDQAHQAREIVLPQRELRALIKTAEFAMAQQDIRYYLNGMLLVLGADSLQAVATDGHRLSWASLKVGGDAERPVGGGADDEAASDTWAVLGGDAQRQEVILPRKTVLELGKLLSDAEDPVRIEVVGNQVRFAFGNIELVSKIVDGKFPDYNRVIPTQHTNSLVLARTELLAALQRAAILSNEKFRGVRLVLGSGQLKIICSNSEQEEAEEELEVDYCGAALDIGFNITYLLDVLQNQPVEHVQIAFGDSNSSALITIPDRDDYKYVVMPMRI